jgi:hypothetical protein
MQESIVRFFVNDVVDAEVIKTGRKWCGNYSFAVQALIMLML